MKLTKHYYKPILFDKRITDILRVDIFDNILGQGKFFTPIMVLI